jgi:predicted dehydrogenase
MTLRVGVIGLGVGEKHIEAYETHSGCEVVAACDFDPAARERVGERYPDLRIVADASELLGEPEIDGVSIASYDSHHADQVMRAIESGKHVFVEKPLCTREEEAARIFDALSRRPELKLSSNLPLRRSPRFQLVKRLIDDGELGRLYYLEGDYEYGRLWKLTEGWRGDEDDYSVVLGGAVHIVDLLLWWTGERVVGVTARGNAIATEGTKFRYDDFVVATLELASGALAKVSANFACVRPHFHAIKVFGTEGTFINGDAEATLYRGEPGSAEAEPIDAAYPGVEKGELIHSFVDSILGEGEPEVTVDEIRRTMEVCFAIDRAAAERTAVRVGEG